ncbi:MAG: tetratricopeptide repeat protein [Acidobacteria bacterium]|nr:tetratricopeptide repeat protein [Acidobacteriota bacterium]
MTHHKDAAVLDVLAAAYAAAGRFDEAVATARAALALLPSQSELATSIRHRLDLYTKGLPYPRPRQ